MFEISVFAICSLLLSLRTHAQVQLLERKVSRASGKRSQEETLILNKRIKELETEAAAATEQFDMLTVQVRARE